VGVAGDGMGLLNSQTIKQDAKLQCKGWGVGLVTSRGLGYGTASPFN
jgi:hypothetical protein